MKAKIKATGEIINIASYATITLDKCNSYGTPIEVRPEDVELIADIEEDGYWQHIKIQAAIACLAQIVGNIPSSIQGDYTEAYVKEAINYADELVKQLKEK